MKLTSEGKKSVTVGATGMTVQGINLENTKAVISILRDKIYTDKPKAAITETLCNAVDEHRKYNVDRPVDLIITQKNLIIRDYAKGLDEEGVTKVFFQYMNSTKSDNNYDIGGYGIGAKSPSSYTAVWYVVSYHAGKKTTYMSVIDNEEGKTFKMLEQECEADNTGICVIIPLEGDTIYERNRQALNFVQIAQDLTIMLGYNSDKPDVKGYYVEDEASTVCDYDDFIKLSDEGKEKLNQNFNQNRMCSYHIKAFANRQVPNNDFYTYVSVPGEALIIRGNNYGNRSIFKSNFFSSSRFLAYDGDICYNVRIPNNILRKYHIEHTNSLIILFFKRGELSIAPTREDISMSNSAAALLDSKLELLDKEFKRIFKEEFTKAINEGCTVGKAMDSVRDYATLDFGEYNRGVHVIDKIISDYPNLANLYSNREFIPRPAGRYRQLAPGSKDYSNLVEAVMYVTMDAETGKIKTSISKRYSAWNGYDIDMSDPLIYLSVATTNTYKNYYRSELAVGVVESIKDNVKKLYDSKKIKHSGLNLNNYYNFNLVIIKDIETLKEYFKSKSLKDKEIDLFRKGIDYLTIDDIVSKIPARVVNRVTVPAVKGKRTKSVKVLKDFIDDNIIYKDEDIKDKKVLIIPATELIQDSCEWKRIKNIVASKRTTNRSILTWLTGYDIVAKVYKEDINYWVKKGAIKAALTKPDIRNMFVEGVRKRKIISLPSFDREYAYLDPNNVFDKKFSNYINLDKGSAVTPKWDDGTDATFDLYDVHYLLDRVDGSILSDIRRKSMESVTNAIRKCDEDEYNTILQAIYKHSVSIPCYVGTSIENCGLVTNSNIFYTYVNKLRRQEEEDSVKKANPSFEKLINNIDIQLI